MRSQLLFLVAVLALALGNACGSVLSSNDNHDGGGAGTGGKGGHAGAPGGAGGGSGAGGTGLDTCGVLEAQYLDALAAAQACDTDATGQCLQLVSSSLSSPCFVNCMTYVNDATALNAIKSLWEQAGCNNVDVLCPAIACLQPSNDMCLVGDGGGGVCSSSTLRVHDGGAGAGGATGSGGNGGSGGSMTCIPACGSGSVCVASGTEGGAIIAASDAGVCPSGTHATGSENRCTQDLAYSCMLIPAACGSTVTCACASSLCSQLHICQGPSAGILTCVEEVP